MNFYKYNKYGNQKVVIDNITFDSIKEGDRYNQLKLMDRGGFIDKLFIHPRFLLQDKFIKNGIKYRAIYYEADFDIWWKDGTRDIEDVKGVRTSVFKLKEKMFHFMYPELKLIIS